MNISKTSINLSNSIHIILFESHKLNPIVTLGAKKISSYRRSKKSLRPIILAILSEHKYFFK